MSKRERAKMPNIGKIFEAQLKASTPDYALLYRLPDSAQSFGGGNLRFSAKSPFDFILWDSQRRILYALEAKTVQGQSVSYERDKTESGVIHYHQIASLRKWASYNITAGFIIEFRKLEKTIFLPISSFDYIAENSNKKSLNYSDIINSEQSYIEIAQTKKRTRYTYDIDGFLREADHTLVEKRERNED